MIASREQAITRIRDDLLAEHLGVEPARFSEAVAAHGSVIRALDGLSGASERRLIPFPPPRPSALAPYEHNALMDPYRPIGSRWSFLSEGGANRRHWGAAAATFSIGVLAGLALLYCRDASAHRPSASGSPGMPTSSSTLRGRRRQGAFS